MYDGGFGAAVPLQWHANFQFISDENLAWWQPDGNKPHLARLCSIAKPKRYEGLSNYEYSIVIISYLNMRIFVSFSNRNSSK